jgi:phospholipid/cholesterol/gamma-HCH transport system substrate-binding protein
VPPAQTRAVLGQLDAGLHEADGDIGGLVDASSLLLQAAQARIDATTGLIGALEPVLATQQDLSAETVAYARDLATFTEEVAGHDADLRSLLETGPQALASATSFVQEISGPLPLLLANVTTTAQVFNTYLPNLEQTLVVYPATVARLQSTVNPRAAHGDVQLDLKATFNDPPHCIAGYLPASQRRSPSDQSLREVDGTAHCRAAAAGPAAVRGARNLPCVNSGARGALPADCGVRFRSGLRAGASGSVPYDAVTGRFVGPDGRTYHLDTPTPTGGEDAWKSLVLGPLGLG